MTDKKISALPSAVLPFAGTEVLPVVQSGVTKQVSVAALTAGRSPEMNYAVVNNGVAFQNSGVARWILEREAGGGDDLAVYRYNDAGGYAGNPLMINRSNGNVRLEGNIVVGNSGRGIDFSASGQAGGMTSELLNDYEEGTWTPTMTSALGVVTVTASAGSYTKVGNVVSVAFSISYSTDALVGISNLTIGGLPFTAAPAYYAKAQLSLSNQTQSDLTDGYLIIGPTTANIAWISRSLSQSSRTGAQLWFVAQYFST